VNDGSEDNSESVIRQYPVILINQENAGVSAARNRGIEEAKGEYITFADVDDYIDADSYRAFISCLIRGEQAYMNGYRIIDRNESKTKEMPFPAGKYGKKEIHYLQRCLTDVNISRNQKTHYLGGKVYQYVVRRDFFNYIEFPEGVPYAEDLCYCMQLFDRLDSIVVTDYIVYNYCVNNQSVMHQAREFFWEEYCRVFKRIHPYVEDNTVYNRFVYWAGLGVIDSYITYDEYTEKIPSVIIDPQFQEAVHNLDYNNWTFRERIEFSLLCNKHSCLWILYKRIRRTIRNGKLGGYENYNS
jgi:glycosyltransferase involved in cell wall biosynthesis